MTDIQTVKKSQLSPATWVLAGKREALLEYARSYALKTYIWPLPVAAAIAIPVGLRARPSVSPNQRTAQSGIDTVNHPTDSTFAGLVDKETRKQGTEIVSLARFPPRLPVSSSPPLFFDHLRILPPCLPVYQSPQFPTLVL